MTRTRTQLLAAADSLLNQPTLSREDSARVSSLIALADSQTDKTELRKATMAARNRELGRPGPEVAEPTPRDEQFRAYLWRGKEALAEQRDMGVTTDAAGNYIVPASFADRMEVAMKAYDGLFAAATLFSPARGSAFNFPVLEDTGNSAAIVAENSASTAGPDAVYAGVAFGKCPMYRSGLFRASVEVVTDSAFDFENMLAAAAGIRMARGIGAALVATLLTEATSGLTAASPTAVTIDEIFNLVDSVDEAFQANGSFLMRQSTLNALKKLKGSTSGDYLLAPDPESGRMTLLGYPVYASPSMGPLTTGQKPIAFGDLSRFVRRQVSGSVAIKVFVERYAELSQTGFEAYLRSDGHLLKTASTTPVKFITMA